MALSSRPMAHHGRRPRPRTRRCQGLSWHPRPCPGRSWRRSTSRGRERRSRGGPEHRACELSHWSSRAASARVKGGSKREKEEGARGLACCGRRGTSTGARGRLEVVGDAASTVACSASRCRACKWPASVAFRAHPRVHLCLASAGRVNKREGGFGCSVTCQEWERDEKGRESGFPEKKNGSLPPSP